MAAAARDTILDTTLDNIKRAALNLSQVVLEESEALQSGEYDLPALVHSAEKQANTILKLIEAAPFLQVKSQIEGTSAFLEWLLHSDIVGEAREMIIDAVQQYQSSIITTTQNSPQYRLL